MSFPDAIASVLRRYAGFAGRARRAEYWWWWLFCALVVVVLSVPALSLLVAAANAERGELDPPGQGLIGGVLLVLLGLFGVVTALPSLAVLVRRLHDIGHSGWWCLLGLVPVAGPVILTVLALVDGIPGPNGYGPDPRGRAAAT